MKSDQERGPWGAWLRRERQARGLSPEQVRALMAARGHRVGESAYAEWESGYKREPSKDAQPHLIAIFGSEPDLAPEPLGQPETPAALVSALLAQTEAMDRHTDALTRQADALAGLVSWLQGLAGPAVERGVARAMAEAAALAASGSPGTPPTPPSPRTRGR